MDLTNISYGVDALGIQAALISLTGFVILGLILVLLKGFALYKAARLQEKVWFWVLLLVNTAGILEIIYIYMRRDRK